MIGARIATGVALVALACTGIALARHEATRDAWRLRGAAIGTRTYDAAASDAAFRDVEDALAWVERAVRVAAAAVVGAGIAIGRARVRRTRPDGTRARRIAARAIDVLALALALAASRLRASSPGITEALAWLVPAVTLAVLGGLAASGATLGARVVAARA